MEAEPTTDFGQTFTIMNVSPLWCHYVNLASGINVKQDKLLLHRFNVNMHQIMPWIITSAMKNPALNKPHKFHVT